MNGDTIVINGMNEEEQRRVKRARKNNNGPSSYRFKQYVAPKNNKILINQENLGESAALRTSEAIRNAHYGPVDKPSPSTPSSAPLWQPYTLPVHPIPPFYSAGVPATGKIRPKKHIQIKLYNPHAKSQTQSLAQVNGGNTNIDSNDLDPSLNGIPVVSRQRSFYSVSKTIQRNPIEQPDQISFSAAPDNPVALVWWLVNHINHLADMEAPPSQPSPSVHENDQVTSSTGVRLGPDSDYSKEQARRRQQKWRASNRERKNINDLRSRINREAKLKFGEAGSAEKAAWIEGEFLKRRSKLESKLAEPVADLGQFPLFRITREGRSGITVKDYNSPLSARQMRTFVIELLFPVSGRRYKKHLESSAVSLLELSKVDTRTRDQELKAILKSIASTPEALKSIRSGMHLQDIGSEEVRTPDRLLSGSNDSDIATDNELARSSRRPTHEAASRYLDPSDKIATKSKELMEAIESAVKMLAEINNVSPSATTNIQSKQRETRATARKEKPSGAGIDLDAFLVTANAGPLESPVSGEEAHDSGISDDNDETISDTNEENETSPDKDQTDSQIWREIDQVIDQLVDKRVQYEKKHKIKTGFDAKAQADRARELLLDTHLRTNSAMTKAESEAMSHLYTQLSKLVNSDIKTAESNGTSSDIRNGQRSRTSAPKISDILASPAIQTPSSAGSRDTPNISSLPPRHNFSKLSLSQHVEARTEEEQRKIRSYGFPPLPGSKVGTRRHYS